MNSPGLTKISESRAYTVIIPLLCERIRVFPYPFNCPAVKATLPDWAATISDSGLIRIVRPLFTALLSLSPNLEMTVPLAGQIKSKRLSLALELLELRESL